MPKKRPRKNSNLPRLMILVGLALVIAVILVAKEKPQVGAVSGEAPAAQLARLLEAGQPTLAFFHSNNCDSCLQMIAIVNQVYPEYKGTVSLVDINVYDPQNRSLLQAVGLQYIPTQIFYDRKGNSDTMIGVMQPEELYQALSQISEN